MTMGEKILNMRKARGWNQEELAERVGVTRQAVSRWEAGSAKPDADKIIAICDLFGVSADYLLRDQYSGEGRAAQVEKPPVNVLTAKARTLTIRQWSAVGMSLVGGLVLLVLKLVYAVMGIDYYVQTSNNNVYTGFQGFLSSNELFIIWYLALLAFLGGLIYLFVWPIIRKDKEKNGWPWERD